MLSAYMEGQDQLRIEKARKNSTAQKRADRKEKWLEKRRNQAHQELEEGPTYVSGGF